MTESPMRSGESSPFGKCTEEIKTKVPEIIHDEFVALATLSGMSKSEYLRELISNHVRGHFHTLKLKHQRTPN